MGLVVRTDSQFNCVEWQGLVAKNEFKICGTYV